MVSHVTLRASTVCLCMSASMGWRCNRRFIHARQRAGRDGMPGCFAQFLLLTCRNVPGRKQGNSRCKRPSTGGSRNLRENDSEREAHRCSPGETVRSWVTSRCHMLRVPWETGDIDTDRNYSLTKDQARSSTDIRHNLSSWTKGDKANHAATTSYWYFFPIPSNVLLRI